jgi:hypothetical protein
VSLSVCISEKAKPCHLVARNPSDYTATTAALFTNASEFPAKNKVEYNNT